MRVPGALPGGEALLVGQNPVFSDQGAPTHVHVPEHITVRVNPQRRILLRK